MCCCCCCCRCCCCCCGIREGGRESKKRNFFPWKSKKKRINSGEKRNSGSRNLSTHWLFFFFSPPPLPLPPKKVGIQGKKGGAAQKNLKWKEGGRKMVANLIGQLRDVWTADIFPKKEEKTWNVSLFLPSPPPFSWLSILANLKKLDDISSSSSSWCVTHFSGISGEKGKKNRSCNLGGASLFFLQSGNLGKLSGTYRFSCPRKKKPTRF